MEYTVKWEIQVEANSPEAAARQALEIQRDFTSTATVFEIYDPRCYLLKTVDVTDTGTVWFEGKAYEETQEQEAGSCVGCAVRNGPYCSRSSDCIERAVILKKLSQ